MKFAIIAAGEGSRLAAEGIDAPKPMVKVHGEHLIDRLIRVFMKNNAEEIVVICNDKTTIVSRHSNGNREDYQPSHAVQKNSDAFSSCSVIFARLSKSRSGLSASKHLSEQ